MLDSQAELETAEASKVADIYESTTYPWIKSELRPELQRLIPQLEKTKDKLPTHIKLADLFGDFVQQIYLLSQLGEVVIENCKGKLHNDLLRETNGRSVINCVKGRERQVREHLVGAMGVLTFKNVLDSVGFGHLSIEDILPENLEYDVIHKTDLIIKTGEVDNGKEVYAIVQLKTDANATGVEITNIDPNSTLNEQGINFKKYKIDDSDVAAMASLIPRLQKKGTRPNAEFRLFSVVVPQYGGAIPIDVFGRITNVQRVAQKFKSDAEKAGFLP